MARSVNCLGHVFNMLLYRSGPVDWGGAHCAGESWNIQIGPTQEVSQSQNTTNKNRARPATATRNPRPGSQVHGPQSKNTEQKRLHRHVQVRLNVHRDVKIQATENRRKTSALAFGTSAASFIKAVVEGHPMRDSCHQVTNVQLLGQSNVYVRYRCPTVPWCHHPPASIWLLWIEEAEAFSHIERMMCCRKEVPLWDFFFLERHLAQKARSLSVLNLICIPQSTNTLDQGGVEPRQAVSPRPGGQGRYRFATASVKSALVGWALVLK